MTRLRPIVLRSSPTIEHVVARLVPSRGPATLPRSGWADGRRRPFPSGAHPGRPAFSAGGPGPGGVLWPGRPCVRGGDTRTTRSRRRGASMVPPTPERLESSVWQGESVPNSPPMPSRRVPRNPQSRSQLRSREAGLDPMDPHAITGRTASAASRAKASASTSKTSGLSR
jgi:hypothetical protein